MPFDPYVTAATGGDPYGSLSPSMGSPSPWASVFDALAGAGMGLMQASAPSATPKDFGTLFGGLAGGAAMGLQGAEDKRLKRMLVGSQVAMAQQKIKQLTEWQKLLSGDMGATSAPTDAGTFAPSPSPQTAGGGGTSPDREKFVQTMMPHALEVAQATGLDPRLVLAQSALETGYGSAAPGNNYFGIKSHGAPGGQTLSTTEVGASGPYQTKESFRTYADPGASARDYAEFLKTNSRYAPVLQAKGLDAQIDAMGRSGYATDPNYTAKLRQIASSLSPAQMPGPPAGLVPPGSAMAQMPGPPQELIPPGPPPAQMPMAGGPVPGVPGPIAAPPMTQGDGSGNPVVQAQYTPQASPAPTMAPPQAAPRSMADVVRTIPPAMRQMIGAMGPEKGMEYIMKYADPETVPAFDPRSGEMVFVPKTALKSGRYQPAEAANYGLSRERFGFDQRKWTEEQKREAEKFGFEKEKYGTEQKQKGQFVRGPDGVQRWVPADQYAGGMPNYDKPPEPGAPGTETGDVGTLGKAFNNPDFAKSPEYAAAYNRLAGKLIDGPGGLKYAPNMSAYPPPAPQQQGGAPGGAPPGMQQIGERNYTEGQNKDHTYASRLDNAIPQLEALIKGGKLPSSISQKKANSPYFPETFVPDDAKEFRRVIKDIMTATLRRESGATILDAEFVSETQKFIPQPGDSPGEIERKLNALKLAARTIAEASGRDRGVYSNLFGGGQAAPQAPQGGAQFNYVPGKGLVPR
jgi:hypothetical protein